MSFLNCGVRNFLKPARICRSLRLSRSLTKRPIALEATTARILSSPWQCLNYSTESKPIAGEPEEKYDFMAETQMLLGIVANALYSNKEIFLRELISNASDALEKYRYSQITKDVSSSLGDLQISITTDKQNRKIIIEDNGIGLTKQELIDNLGTIARSGSKAFLNDLKNKGQENQVNAVIGQFGVGFYSVFMVANKVDVITKSYQEGNQAWKWTSDGSGSYSISPCNKKTNGTEIIVHLKPESRDFADDTEVEKIIKKYSGFVNYPILVNGNHTNKLKPVWLMNPKEVTKQQHDEFYQFLSATSETPIFCCHSKSDVPYNVNVLLYFPRYKPVLFDQVKTGAGVALYARRVLITDRADELIPRWLRFVRGVVDSEDIPLNLSREILQKTPLLRKISEIVKTKAIKFLQEKSVKDKEEFLKFYREFDLLMKEGIISTQDQTEKEEIAKLLHFESSKNKAGELISIPEYCSRMIEGQNKIFYLVAPSRALAESSPYLEAMKQKNVEVLFCYQSYDEAILMHLFQFKNSHLSSVESDIRKSNVNQQDQAEKDKTIDKDVEALISWFQMNFKNKIEKACVNTNLEAHPCIITVEEIAAARQYLRIQGKGIGDDMKYSLIKPRLEINPKHPLIHGLSILTKQNEELALLIAEQLFKNALVFAGLLDDAQEVIVNVNKIMELALKEKCQD